MLTSIGVSASSTMRTFNSRRLSGTRNRLFFTAEAVGMGQWPPNSTACETMRFGKKFGHCRTFVIALFSASLKHFLHDVLARG